MIVIETPKHLKSIKNKLVNKSLQKIIYILMLFK